MTSVRVGATAGELAEMFAAMDPATRVGVKFDPWAPIGRVVDRVRPDPAGGVIVHMSMGDPEWN